jgi:signal transduction histidine kinase
MLEQQVYAFVPYVLGLATIAAFALSVYTWQRRGQAGASWLALTVFTVGLWTACDLFTYLVDRPTIAAIVKEATWALILAAGLFFFRFACVHARRERWWEVARLAVLAVLSVNLLLMATNPYHHLLWPGVRWLTVGAARVPWLESGPAFFWIFRPTACVLPLAGVLALLISAVGSPTFYARQIAVLAVGTLIPVVVNFVFVSPTAPGVDLTPVAVVVFVSAFAVSTFRFGLLGVMPVARSLLLEQLDDGVIVLDQEQRVVDLNAAAQRLLRLTAGWTPGAPAEQLLPFWGSGRPFTAAADGQTLETALGGAPGAILEVTSSIVRAEDGAAQGRLIVAHDVTARARLVRALDAYTETVARDLTHPLASVLDAIAALRAGRTAVSDASARCLQNAAQVCAQMTETVDALLAFAKLRSLEDVDVEPLDMAAIVRAALRRLSVAVAESRAEITVGERWPAAVSHPAWVEEIWTNYVSNAIKYGGRPPRVELGATEADDRMVRCWVRDNGTGLSDAQRRRLFTEFTRLEPQRSEGHGLGLSIVRRIAEKLGGRVGCDSAPGRGSTFWFTLPAAPRQPT